MVQRLGVRSSRPLWNDREVGAVGGHLVRVGTLAWSLVHLLERGGCTLEQGGPLLGAKLFCTVCSVLIPRCSQTLESLYLPPN